MDVESLMVGPGDNYNPSHPTPPQPTTTDSELFIFHYDCYENLDTLNSQSHISSTHAPVSLTHAPVSPTHPPFLIFTSSSARKNLKEEN